VNGRTAERVERARSEIVAKVSGARVEAAVGDVGTAEGVGAVLRVAPSVDILVNNAGIFAPVAFGDITDDDWKTFFETNVLSGVRFSRAYFPRMKEAGWGGSSLCRASPAFRSRPR
jgi:NAD(P)-dependent dehydrogenase (short-subunit alcohol dehydrogenase family)